MGQKNLYTVFLLSLLSFYSCNGIDRVGESKYKLDSLNIVAFNFRYVNIDSTRIYAEQVYTMAGKNRRQRAMALNTMAFAASAKMDYENSYNLYNQVYSITNNKIEWLVALVGMMNICQHISDNMAFYELRNRALITLSDIESNIEGVSHANIERLMFARNELRIVSAIYYQELDQIEKAYDELNQVDIDIIYNGYYEHLAFYCYLMSRGIKYIVNVESVGFFNEVNFLNRCVTVSHQRGYEYTYSMGLMDLSVALLENPEIVLPKHIAEIVLNSQNLSDIPVNELSEQLALQALAMAEKYGGRYELIECYRELSKVYIAVKKYNDAIDVLSMALAELNDNVIIYYPHIEAIPLLENYRDDGLIVERVWLEEIPFATVPECMSTIRELMSLAYSGLSNKVLSDYNRNVYLELQKSIRLDRTQEAREANLKRVNRELNAILWAVIVIILFIVIFFTVAGQQLRKRGRQHIDVLKRMMILCEKALSTPPMSDKISLENSIANVIKTDLDLLVGASHISIWSGKLDKNPAEREGCIMTLISLWSVNGNNIVGGMAVYTKKSLNKYKMTLLNTIIPYVAAALENGQMLAELDKRKITAGKEHFLAAAKLEENKRENLARKASYSVVSDCSPFIDRLLNEISKLKTEKPGSDRYNYRLQYISELAGMINEYNKVLSKWIQSRQGIVSLRIENFSLKPLFDIIDMGARSFAQKNLELNVGETNAIIKADRALTLFMINTLVDNAGKFTPSGGKVSLFALEKKDYIEISVCDTGIGLSNDDIKLILDNKVYDAGVIGATNKNIKNISEIKDKGSGFGLMNCKGIIEQYRNSDNIFKVCLFGIESREGAGSRFFFRLPKGVLRGILGLIMIFFSGIGVVKAQHIGNNNISAQDTIYITETGDSLLFDAYYYTDMAYQYNILGEYQIALNYIDSALYALNSDYLIYGGDSAQTLSLLDFEQINELKWLEREFGTDYETILWLRNEAAVSALALKKWDLYRYNNDAYLKLFKKYFSEKEIERDCIILQHSNSNISIAIILFILILMLFLLFRYAFFSKRRLQYRNDLEQVLDILREISAATVLSKATEQNNDETDTVKIAERIAKDIYPDLYRLLSVKNVVVAVSNETELSIGTYSKKGEIVNDNLINKTRESFENSYSYWNQNNLYQTMPLMVESFGTWLNAGALGLEYYDNYRDTDLLMAGMVARYLAVAVYNRVLKVAERYNYLERIRDESERARFEDNRLRVQNLILDNCLSTLKHETIYYPNRITQIIKELNRKRDDYKGNEILIQDMLELVTYYRDIFKILSQYAARQLDDSLFKRQRVEVRELMTDATDYFRITANKQGNSAVLITDECYAACSGDRTMLCFLIRNLIDQALDNREHGEIKISATVKGSFVQFLFSDNRRLINWKNLNMIFSPLWKGPDYNQDYNNHRYVMCRQIIREHDEAYGHPGCRINAEPDVDGGLSIWFTVPSVIINE
ncbi:MAG TPA: DUF5113 domain-containing protein [Bacteroidaceae bacterium]|nr:DUF5113 domain-containing protein [Bacteroidaceae bacterium]